ncbi:MAG: DUF1844 domain-containing protein [Candidatus Zixiibacteriota bacterium]|nr:MAG: DUF1844 domain-containing protein [candidate division Zixibacteria bacterium]
MSDEERNNSGIGPDSKSLGSYFVQLVLSFHAAAWQQMGKVASIMTGKIERDLNMAKHSIDMLGMLEEKTRGNLTEDEEKYLKHALYELRMNYLDEMKKSPDQAKKERETAESKPPEDEDSSSNSAEESKSD